MNNTLTDAAAVAAAIELCQTLTLTEKRSELDLAAGLDWQAYRLLSRRGRFAIRGAAKRGFWVIAQG